MKLRKILILTAALVFANHPASAFSLFGKNEVSGAFCSGLKKEKLYKKYDLENYSYLIEGNNGWIFRSENDFRSEWHVNAKTVQYLKVLQSAFRANNAELIIVAPPIRGLAHASELSEKDKKRYGLADSGAIWDNYETSINDLRAQGVNVVGVNRDEITPDFFYKRDHHWTASGARVTAQKVSDIIKSLPAYADIKRVQYVTIEQPPVAYKSSFEKAFKKICDTELPSEPALQFVTTPVSAAQDQSELFAAQKDPQIVLLGTSNSVMETSQANFEGFLKEYLSTDILNVAYMGAGIDTSIISYLNSDHFRNGQSKIVIWEVPGYYDLNVMDDKLFNQIIPATYGQCSHAPVYSTHIGSLSAGNNLLVDMKKIDMSQNSGLSEDILKRPLYMNLSFSKPVKEKFTATFQYENDGTKKQQFDRSERYPYDGKFYTLFPLMDKNSELSRISGVFPSEAEGLSVDVQICPMPAGTTLPTVSENI